MGAAPGVVLLIGHPRHERGQHRWQHKGHSAGAKTRETGCTTFRAVCRIQRNDLYPKYSTWLTVVYACAPAPMPPTLTIPSSYSPAPGLLTLLATECVPSSARPLLLPRSELSPSREFSAGEHCRSAKTVQAIRSMPRRQRMGHGATIAGALPGREPEWAAPL